MGSPEHQSPDGNGLIARIIAIDVTPEQLARLDKDGVMPPMLIAQCAEIYNAVNRGIADDMARIIAMWKSGEITDEEYDREKTVYPNLPSRSTMRELRY